MKNPIYRYREYIKSPNMLTTQFLNSLEGEDIIDIDRNSDGVIRRVVVRRLNDEMGL